MEIELKVRSDFKLAIPHHSCGHVITTFGDKESWSVCVCMCECV